MNIAFIVPVYNEAKNITSLVQKLKLISSYEYLCEVLIIDGGSIDGTKNIVKKLSFKLKSEFFKIVFLSNPEKLQAEALNIGLKNASNRFCVRLDAHLNLGSIELIRKSLRSSYNILNLKKACSVGYKQRFAVTSNIIQNSLFLLSMSPFLSGFRSYRLALFNKFSFTSVWLFSLFKEEAVSSGGFILEETPNEDMGFNERISALSGLPLFLDVNFPIYYYPRRNYYDLFKQYFRYGFSRSTRRIKKESILSIFYSIFRPIFFLISFKIIFLSILFPKFLLIFYLLLMIFCLVQICLDKQNSLRIFTNSILERTSLFLSFFITPLSLIIVLLASFIGSISALLYKKN